MKRTFYFADEFCSVHRISKATFYKDIRAERLHVVKCGKNVLIGFREAKRWRHERQRHFKRRGSFLNHIRRKPVVLLAIIKPLFRK